MKITLYSLALAMQLVVLNMSSQAPIFFRLSPADSLRESGDLKGAIEEFRRTYYAQPKNENNLYNFSCALALSRMNDSCFKYLNMAIELDTTMLPLTDPDFIYVKSDRRWSEFEDRLIGMVYQKNHKPIKDIEYAKQLWRMHATDQAYYSEINTAEKKIGRHSTVVMALWNLKILYNDENLARLENLIEEKGWPKISEVGEKAAGAAFLVIQHSDIDKQKRYIPEIEKQCKLNEASWQSYALMYDRIEADENRPQKYGSQVIFNDKTNKYELLPLLDETRVDEWRKEVGLPPLADYLARWDIKFEPGKK